MKCYLSQDRLQLVGKAWEVNHYLKQLRRDNRFGEEPLFRVLERISANSPQASAQARTEQQRIHSGNRPDRA